MKETVKSTSLVLLGLAISYALIYLRPQFDSIVLEGLIFTVGLYVLVVAASVFTTMSVALGDLLGLSKLGTGILIIAIGTSAPELFASISAAIQSQPEMVVGNVLGTVVANCLLGIGFGALVATVPLTVHRDVFGTQMSVFLVAVLLAIGSLYDGAIQYYEGIVMLVLLAFYLHYVVRSSRAEAENEASDEDADEHPPILVLMGFLAINLAALFLSGDVVISALVEAASILNYSGAILATSLLAVGTSIPEIATAIALVRQNNADSLFGEIIGSNIFDLLGIFGIISLFSELTMRTGLLEFLLISLLVMFIVTSIIMNDKKITRIEGVSLLSLFVLFTIQLVNF